jgi:callose synthase
LRFEQELMASSSSGSGQLPQRPLSRSQTMGSIADPVSDSELVPSSLSEIAPILRVANEVEPKDPRVAYLCEHSQPLF